MNGLSVVAVSVQHQHLCCWPLDNRRKVFSPQLLESILKALWLFMVQLKGCTIKVVDIFQLRCLFSVSACLLFEYLYMYCVGVLMCLNVWTSSVRILSPLLNVSSPHQGDSANVWRWGVWRRDSSIWGRAQWGRHSWPMETERRSPQSIRRMSHSNTDILLLVVQFTFILIKTQVWISFRILRIKTFHTSTPSGLRCEEREGWVSRLANKWKWIDHWSLFFKFSCFHWNAEVCWSSAGCRDRGGRPKTHSGLVQLQSASNRRGVVHCRQRKVFC